MSGPAIELQKQIDSILSTFTVPPDRVYLDNFRLKRIGNNGFFTPHAGQSIWVLPYGGQLGEAFAQLGFSRAMQSGDSAEMDKAVDAMCRVIAERIAAWDLRDPATGEPYPQPFRNPAVIRERAASLVWHMYSLVLGIEPEGNADGGEVNSPPISSTTRGQGAKITRAKAAPRRRPS